MEHKRPAILTDEKGTNGIYWRLLREWGPFVDPVERLAVARAIKAARKAVRLVVRRAIREAVRLGFEGLRRQGLLPAAGGDDAGA